MSRDNKKSNVLLPVLVTAFAIPLSMLFWIINVIYSILSPRENQTEDHAVISPWRWLAAIVIPILFSLWGLKRRSLDLSGAMLGLVVGFVLTITNYAYLADLMCFFVSSSLATKFRMNEKRKLEVDFKEGGQRNWIQVLCNGGMALQLALLYLLDVGCGERALDFDKDYRSSWLSIGILGAFSCCNGDTWASEFGTAIGNSDPFLITTRTKVPRGTNGAVSLVGLLMSLLGGLLVGVFHYLAVLYTVDSVVLENSAPQWPIIVIAGLGGLLGSILDSIFGATLQYSGINEEGKIVERPGKGVKHICGRQILDNHSVNLLSSIAIALTLPRIANFIWPFIK
ncbi:GSCOCG00004984001-RA-CDS [Cotesia congregata]|uniref:Transmembrane protein 19 n=1 Tax=Cotesia congregata TaxID=51543 RepID=A0A8J2EA93_COTCN|nr:GSCOCG00004984001-RA-CDS [Cotesia congregata]CAG5073383.1 Similar to TMEM19: Transmembrane protein 19 (Homo sapiens) [Cotesia congregata]